MTTRTPHAVHRWIDDPAIVAVVLAAIAVPIVAVTGFRDPLAGSFGSRGGTSSIWPDALVLSAASLLVAALVAGLVAGRLVSTRPVAAGFVAIAIAWPLAIAMLPLAAAAARIPLATAMFCIDGCSPTIGSDRPLSGINAYAGSLFVVGILAVVVPLAWVLRRRPVAATPARPANVLARLIVVVVLYGGLHVFSVSHAPIAFGCLAVGTIAWSMWLSRSTGEAADLSR